MDAEVAWIAESTPIDRTITAAIPPVFDAYATIVVAYGEERVKHDRAVLALLAEQSPDQRWWLGYDPVRAVALRAGRGGTGTGRRLASE
jgi:hypothetical protein